MAVIHDVMPAFELFQPASIGDVVTLLNRYGSDAWMMAGGMDSFDWLKDRIKRPSVVIDLSQVESLRGIKALDGGLEIGAGTTLTEVVRDPLVRDRFGLLAEAAELVASPQIRNQGTIGGNVSQDTRCWYYRAGWSCYRAGGNICYADTPTAINREHAILGRRPVRGGEPVRHGAGTRRARCADGHPERARRARRRRRGLLHRPGRRHHAHDGPGAGRAADGDSDSVDVGRRAVLLREGPRPERLGLPVAQRGVGGDVTRARSIDRIRMVINAAAARPLRLHAVEAAVVGKPRNEQTAELAGQIAIAGGAGAALQRLQDSVDAQPGEAGHSRRWEVTHGFRKVGTQSLGTEHPHPRLLDAVLGVSVRRPDVPRGTRRATCCCRHIASDLQTETDRLEAAHANLPERIERHSLMARRFTG